MYNSENYTRTVVHIVNDGDIGGIQCFVKGVFLDYKDSPYRQAVIIRRGFGKVIGPGDDRYSLMVEHGLDIRNFRRLHAVLRRYPRAVVVLHIDMALARLFIPRSFPAILMEHGCTEVRQKFRTINHLIGNYACRHAHAVVCNSNFSRATFEAAMPASRGISRTLYNPVLIQFSAPRKYPAHLNPTIGFIGRFSQEKGPLEFIDCAKEIYARRSSLRFTMIGDGPLLAAARKKAADLNLPVVFTGGVLNVAERLKDIDLLVVTSSKEAFNMAMAEAMASGVPVAGYPNAAIPEIISQGETGVLAERGDPAMLAAAVLRILDDRRLYEAISLNAFAFAKRTFDLGAYRAAWNELFDAAFSSGAPASVCRSKYPAIISPSVEYARDHAVLFMKETARSRPVILISTPPHSTPARL